MTQTGDGRRAIGLLVMAVTMLAACAGSSPYLKQVDSVDLIIFHRMFPAYRETTSALPDQTVVFGDEDFTYRVVDFFPDFQMDAQGNVSSRTDTLGNPAVKVMIFKGRERVEASWAFPGEGPPHFRQTSRFGFRIKDLHLKVDEAQSGAGEHKR